MSAAIGALAAASMQTLIDHPVAALRLDLEPGTPRLCNVDLPLVRGSDALSIETAEFDVAPVSRRLEHPPSVSGANVSFSEEVRLIGLDLTASTALDANHRITVGRNPGGPVYAGEGLAAGLYPKLLAGMRTSSNGNKHSVSFPPVSGKAFTVQLTQGDSPTALANSGNAAVTTAWIEAVPAELAVSMTVDGTTVPLAARPGQFLPGASQHVAFQPVAEKLLKKPGDAPAKASLSFTSKSAATLAIENASIVATYRARPASQPRKLSIRGGWEPMALDAPAGVAPSASALTIAAKFLGRVLNDASEIAAAAPPAGALRVDTARSVAALAALAPLAGAPAGSTVALASVRLFVAALADAELVVELRANAAGAPGAAIVPQSVVQLAAGDFGWREIVLPLPPPAIATGGAALWVVLRTTKGEALWCADERAGSTLLASTDAMATWSAPALDAPLAPHLQLFHAAVTPPSIALQLRAAGAAQTWTLARTGEGSLNFSSGPASFPPSLHALLQRAPGSARVTTNLELFSTSAIDAVLDGIELSYRVAATLAAS